MTFEQTTRNIGPFECRWRGWPTRNARCAGPFGEAMHDTCCSLADLTLSAVTYQTSHSQWPQLADVRRLEEESEKVLRIHAFNEIADGDGFVSSKALCMIIGAIIVAIIV